MTWVLGLVGPVVYGAVTLFGQASSGGSDIVQILVAMGVITGLSGAVAKLYAENQRLVATSVETLKSTLPPLTEAIAEMRESRQERKDLATLLRRIEKKLGELK